MTYEVKPLTLGGYGVFHGASLLQSFTFEADARTYADRKNAVLAREAEEAERVYLERRAMMFVLPESGPTAADVRATFAPGVR